MNSSPDGVTSSSVPMPEIQSSHEETVVRIVLYFMHFIQTCPGITHYRIRATDRDTFFILLYYANSLLQNVTVLKDTGTRFHIISLISKQLLREYSTSLLALHTVTGVDTTFAFKGKV